MIKSLVLEPLKLEGHLLPHLTNHLLVTIMENDRLIPSLQETSDAFYQLVTFKSVKLRPTIEYCFHVCPVSESSKSLNRTCQVFGQMSCFPLCNLFPTDTTPEAYRSFNGNFLDMLYFLVLPVQTFKARTYQLTSMESNHPHFLMF